MRINEKKGTILFYANIRSLTHRLSNLSNGYVLVVYWKQSCFMHLRMPHICRKFFSVHLTLQAASANNLENLSIRGNKSRFNVEQTFIILFPYRTYSGNMPLLCNNHSSLIKCTWERGWSLCCNLENDFKSLWCSESLEDIARVCKSFR